MSNQLSNVVVVAYGRSAVGRAGEKGIFRTLHPVELAGLTLKGILENKIPDLNPSLIEDVIVGCAQQDKKQSYNIGRLIAQRAGLPDAVSGMTVNRFCSSGIQSIALAAGQIASGISDVLVAGGVESMTAVPMDIDHSEDFDPWQTEHMPDLYMSMGLTAENVAKKYGITRDEMDAFAVESHLRAAAAQDAGKFDDEIIPLPGLDADGAPIVAKDDQGIRRNVSLEKMNALNPCFMEGGNVTAATSSQTSDGASFVVLMSRRKADELGIRPIAKFAGYAVAGCAPELMGEGPMYAVPKVMSRTGLSVSDMDVIELNEAFAAQSIPCIRQLNMNPGKVNPNGGAIALGHPLGATGSVLVCKALSELKRREGKYALVTMCIGGGMGAAAILELG
jgi:acetyl-CoA acyltransferase